MNSTQISGHRPLIMLAVMAAMFMSALEGTVVGTAMPSITGKLGGLAHYSWVFSGYLMAQTVTSLGFGHLADVAGRRFAIIAGLTIFITGSIACGFASSMNGLIAFRLVQGIGAGAIMPLCMTIVGDLFPPNERGKAQSLIATVFGTSSIVGPILGGVIVQQATWAWVFWINVPIAIAAACAFAVLLPAHARATHRPFNITGNVWLAATLSAALIGVSELGSGDVSVAAIAASLTLLCGLAFARIEARTNAPIFDTEIWHHRNISAANASTLLAAMSIIGLTAFLPLYMQIVLGAQPVVAGLALTAIAFGWPMGSTFAGWYQLRLGLHQTMRLGALFVVSGAGVFATLSMTATFLHAATGSFLMGIGMGLLTSASMMIVQEAVQPAKRGQATSSHVFARNLGSVIGATVFGAIFNHQLQGGRLEHGIHEIEAQLAAGRTIAIAPEATVQLAHAVHVVFVTMLFIGAVSLSATTFARQRKG